MTSQETKLSVEGMHCEGCKQRVANVLERLEGVQSAEVELERGEARVEHTSTSPTFDQMKAAVEKAGYTVRRN